MSFLKEWDICAYKRKFGSSLCWIKIGDGPWHWKYISNILENTHVHVYNDQTGKPYPIGQVLCESATGDKVTGQEVFPLSDCPLVQFGYKPIYPGAYWDADGQHIWFLRKRHLKSYKIGLSEETFTIRSSNDKARWRPCDDICLDKPVEAYHVVNKTEVFTNKLIRVGSTLYADGNDIGFMEQGACILKSNKFFPLVSPHLSAQWQIESL